MKMACRKTTVGILLGLVVLIGASLLYAQMGPSSVAGFGNPEVRATMISLYLTKKLDLDASQQQELAAITQDLLQKGKTLHELRTNARTEVVSILRADSVDTQRIQLLQDEHRQAINDFITEAGNRLAEFVNMLSPGQRQTLAQLIEDNTGNCPFH